MPDSIALVESSPVASLLPQHRDHLRASGLTDDTIARASIYSVTDPAEAARLLGWNNLGPAPAIAFPYFGPEGTPTMTILRPDSPRTLEHGRAAKYESPMGVRPRVFYPPATLVHPSVWWDARYPLILIEGLKKSLAAIQAGGFALSAQGTWVWHDLVHKEETGNWRLHPDLASLPLEGRVVYITFDGGDTTRNVSVVHAEAQLARMLLDVGASVRLVRIPAPGPTKVGLDDHLVAQPDPAAALQHLLATAIDADPIARVKAAI